MLYRSTVSHQTLVLARVLGFESRDIAANRAGQLSEQQRGDVARFGRHARFVGAAVLAINAIVVAIAVFTMPTNARASLAQYLPQILVGALLLTMLVVWLSARARPSAGRGARSVQGPIRLEHRTIDGMDVHEMHVGTQCFSIGAAQYRELVESGLSGAACTAHYLAASPVPYLLSAEIT